MKEHQHIEWEVSCRDEYLKAICDFVNGILGTSLAPFDYSCREFAFTPEGGIVAEHLRAAGWDASQHE